MNLIEELPIAILDTEKIKASSNKRKHEKNNPNSVIDRKKLKVSSTDFRNGGKFIESKNVTNTTVHHSPKQRLEICASVVSRPRFIYGNYQNYYGYRNKNKDFQDVRLTILHTKRDMFVEKDVLDIGCNNGFITMEVAKQFPIKHITGVDIDRSLIKQAQKRLIQLKKTAHPDKLNPANKPTTYPFNIHFVLGNYVLRDNVLLDIEYEQFDIILCLSITKWIHLNFGDTGLKQAFRRMFLQLRSGGRLILEPQPIDNYGRRKKMTETIHKNFKSMKLFPNKFDEYLLSSEIGFERMEILGIPEHLVAGFKRPLQIFYKS